MEALNVHEESKDCEISPHPSKDRKSNNNENLK